MVEYLTRIDYKPKRIGEDSPAHPFTEWRAALLPLEEFFFGTVGPGLDGVSAEGTVTDPGEELLDGNSGSSSSILGVSIGTTLGPGKESVPPRPQLIS